MVKLSEAQLLRLIQASATVADLDQRVAHQYGSEHIAEARLRAVELCGAPWVLGPVQQPRSNLDKVGGVLRRPQNVVLWVGVLIAAFAVLYPPYVATVQGITYHTGFHSLLHTVSSGQFGGINVSLLAVELLTIVVIGGALYILAGRVEQSVREV